MPDYIDRLEGHGGPRRTSIADCVAICSVVRFSLLFVSLSSESCCQSRLRSHESRSYCKAGDISAEWLL